MTLHPSFHRLFVVVCLAWAGGCSNPVAPPPPAAGLPSIACPQSVGVDVVDTLATAVEFPPPLVMGGAQPVTAACTLASGSVFNAGKTDITCTATDAMTRSAQCAFSVTVSVVPRLRGTKIVAFGDSMTAGEVSEPFDANVRYLDPENSYPSVLARLLAERYRGQELSVVNEGCPGERVLASGAPCGGGESGEDRVETVVLRHRPDALIVLEGVNGLLTKADAVAIGEGLRRAVRRAIRDGVRLVMVSTILPGAAQGSKPPNPDLVRALNDEIRWWAAREGAVLVDSYAIFQGNETALIGKDGLHPNLDGYRKLADIFLTALVQHFEAPPPVPPPAPSPSLLAFHGRAAMTAPAGR